MKKMKETNKILLNLPASGRRKAFKSSDPADALSNPLQRPIKAAFLFFWLAKTSFRSSNIFSLYVNFKSSLKHAYPSFPVNLNILTVTSRGIWLTVTMKTTDNYHCYIPRLSLNKTSTVVGWFLVMCPWSNSNVSRLGYICAVVALESWESWLRFGKHQRLSGKQNCFPRDHTLSV